MKNIFVLLLSLLSPFVYSQSDSETDPMDVNAYMVNSSGGQVPIIEPVNYDVSGSFYLFDEWNNYAVVYTNKKAVKLTAFNYNLEKDKLEIKISKDSVFTIGNNQIDSLVVNNRVFKPIHPKGAMTDFSEVLAKNDEYIIIKNYYSKVEKSKLNPLTGKYDFPDKVERKFNYYISTDGVNFKSFDVKKKNILNLYTNTNSIKEYFEDRDLSFKKEKDLIFFINNYKS